MYNHLLLAEHVRYATDVILTHSFGRVGGGLGGFGGGITRGFGWGTAGRCKGRGSAPPAALGHGHFHLLRTFSRPPSRANPLPLAPPYRANPLLLARPPAPTHGALSIASTSRAFTLQIRPLPAVSGGTCSAAIPFFPCPPPFSSRLLTPRA